MTGGKRIRSILLGGSWLALAVAGPGAADWNVYVSAGLGISTAIVDTDGTASQGPAQTLSGEDDDSSPLIDGAVGLEIPMSELFPREWLPDLRLPDWPTRFELEAAGLREFELQTKVGNEKFFNELKATTTFVNAWLDIPMVAIYRPIQYTFGLGRQPQIRRWLEPASFYVGSGIGFSYLEIDGTSNIVSGSDEIFDFAWNVGAGFNYALTQNVDLSTGYRYVGIGEQEIDLAGGAIVPGPDDHVKLESQVHEFRMQIRVEVYDFLSPWR